MSTRLITSAPPVLLVDGTGLMVRCNRAAAARGLSSGGVRTGPLMMFISSLARQVREFAPSHLLVAWDAPGALQWRRSLYPGYKAARAPAPLSGDAELGMEFCAAAGIGQLAVAGYEADDVIAAMSFRGHPGLSATDVIICSSDADLHQLLGAGTWMAAFDAQDSKVLGGAWVLARYGCDPPQLPLLKALAGDPSDGIPGVRGYGLAKALKFLRDTQWEWPPLLPDPAQARDAVIYRQILDLDYRAQQLESDRKLEGFSFSTDARWDPRKAINVLPLLERYEMSALAARLVNGTLW